MAKTAFHVGYEMTDVLAGRVRAVVARRAGAQNLRVIHRRNRNPGDITVAVFTYVGGIDMSRTLARRIGAVVTADAVVCDAGMIEIGRYPGHSRMTVIAIVSTGYMRRMLARGDCAVVAAAANTYDLRVIHRIGRCPHGVDVAVLTKVYRVDVGQVLACRIGTVVAADAIVCDAGVIKIGWNPRHG